MPSETLYRGVLVRTDVSEILPPGSGFLNPRFDPLLNHVEIVAGKAALGEISSEYFGFPCQASHRLLHAHRRIPTWHIRPSSGRSVEGLAFISPQGMKLVFMRGLNDFVSDGARTTTKLIMPRSEICPTLKVREVA
jgi:hypothetical protein